MTSPSALAARVYERLPGRVARARTAAGHPLTLAEKTLANHLRDPESFAALERGRSYADFDPDRVALQDALAQIVVLQFMSAGLSRVELPTTRPPTSRTRSTPMPRSTSSCAPRARSTASGSGRRAPGSSTRSCSRTTPSPAA
jgi:hypothetical protein